MTVESLADLIRFSSGLGPTRYCFRGQSDAAWSLIPTAYRGLNELDPAFSPSDAPWIGEIERDLYRIYENESERFLGARAGSKWHKLFLAQHFGVPTRLLDWTWNIFVSAYFAIRSNESVDGSIWVLNFSDFPFPQALGNRPRQGAYSLPAIENLMPVERLRFFDSYSKSEDSDGCAGIGRGPEDSIASELQSNNPSRGAMILVEPPRLEVRLSNQKGLFSVHLSANGDEVIWDHAAYIRNVENYFERKLLAKLVVPARRKAPLAAELNKAGIDALQIFGDINGLVERLRQLRAETYRVFTQERSAVRQR